LTDSGAFVALLAGHSRVRTEKRKAILVILGLLSGNLPTKNAMALRTVRAHLAAVNVSVTILAVFPNVGKHRFDVALRALHFFVHSAERIFRLVVIELWNRTNGAPPSRGVAILTRYDQSSVGATCRFLLRIGERERGRVR
jgi:hypothetical protein